MTTATGRTWKLDLLGNWAGGTTNCGDLIDYTAADGQLGFDEGNCLSGGDCETQVEKREVNAKNAVTRRNAASACPQTSFPSNPTEVLTYDAAGNLIQENSAETGVREYIYDAWNRVAEVRRGDGEPIARYRYDALGRRVNKQVYNSGTLDTVDAGDFFYYDGHRIIEHHKTVEVQDDPDDGGGCVCVEGVCACKSREGLLSESEVSGQYYPVKPGMSDVASPLVGGAKGSDVASRPQPHPNHRRRPANLPDHRPASSPTQREHCTRLTSYLRSIFHHQGSKDSVAA